MGLLLAGSNLRAVQDRYCTSMGRTSHPSASASASPACGLPDAPSSAARGPRPLACTYYAGTGCACAAAPRRPAVQVQPTDLTEPVLLLLLLSLSLSIAGMQWNSKTTMQCRSPQQQESAVRDSCHGMVNFFPCLRLTFQARPKGVTKLVGRRLDRAPTSNLLDFAEQTDRVGSSAGAGDEQAW